MGLSVLLVLLFPVLQFVSAQGTHGAIADVITCGGFVLGSKPKSDAPAAKLDYSHIKIHLFTSEGLLKYTTECAPNGYYFVPVYDRGSFFLSIEGPAGWNFEPKKVPVVVNQQTATCSEDINFYFTGFTLSGRVSSRQTSDCSAGQSGAGGVTLQLRLADGTEVAGRTGSSTVSAADGSFRFANLLPNAYSVVASHAQWKFVKASQTVTMEWGNAELKAPFEITGVDVRGTIASNGEGVPGVDVFLYSESVKALNCAKPVASAELALPNRSEREHVLCHARTSSTGEYGFSEVPCGAYLVVPFYKRFDVSPAEARVAVGHENTVVTTSFVVLGFSVTGRVVDKAGAGIGGVKLAVNGVERAVSDDQGHYKLDRITAGKYTIQATKPHLVFTVLKDFVLSPSALVIPAITVSRFDICGVVSASDAGASAKQPVRTIAVTPTAGTPGAAITVQTDTAGQYCVDVTPGSYKLTPALTASETRAGVLLSPPERVVAVVDRPVLAADFSQARVSLSGRLKCVVACTAPVQIVLTNPTRGADWHQTVTVDKDRWSFANVVPGAYKLTVQQDAWCWDRTALDVTVEYADVTDLEFVQSGYILNSVLSHDLTLHMSLLDAEDEPKPFKLHKGANRFCLAKPGVYRVRPVSCYKFQEESYIYDTSKPHTLELTALAYRVTGVLLVSPAKEFESLTTLAVGVHHEGDALQHVEALYQRTDKWASLGEQPHAKEDAGDEVRVYKYQFWASQAARYEVTPMVTTMTTQGTSTSLLFYPRSQPVTVAGKDCAAPVPAFHARSGSYVSGMVHPGVKNVLITVTSLSDDESTAPVVVTVKSESDGHYKAGPLYDDLQYKITAYSEGYHLTRVPGSPDFRAKKLGQITISVEDRTGGVAGVLLSLSGGDAANPYRNNNQTDAQGKFSFLGLNPGQYFLRPLLKEYEFDPLSKTIEVKEAADVVEKVTATRVAYSVFGVVRGLNNEAEKHVVVEAIEILPPASTGYPRHEETVSDEAGSYRLRGLLPGKRYRIRVKPTDRIERAAPWAEELVMSKQDQQGVNFVVFRKPTKYDLTGVINATAAARDFLDGIEVTVTTESSPGTVVKSHAISRALPFFEFSGLPQDQYIVTVRFNLATSPTRTHHVTIEPVTVGLSRHSHVVLPFDAQPKHMTAELQQTSFLGLFLGALLLLLFVYRNQVWELVQVALNKRGDLSGSGSGSGSSGDGEGEDVKSPRRYQKKRGGTGSGVVRVKYGALPAGHTTHYSQPSE